MAQDGEAIYEVFTLVAENPLPSTPSLDLPALRNRDCCNDFVLKYLADISTNDEFKNDVAGFPFWFNSLVSTATLELHKFNDSISDYAFLVNLNDDTYGTFFSFGSYVNSNNENFIGYKLNWKDVLTLHGAGGYKVICTATLGIGGSGTVESSPCCLKQYTPYLADGTIRIEYNISNVIGDNSDDKKIKDFTDLYWYNSLRLGGYFGFPTSTYEQDYIKYDNGQNVSVEDEQEPEYFLKLKPQPSFVHEIMRTDVMQSDAILITDYNSKNANNLVQKAVIKNGEYAPDWKRMQNKLATVEVKFRQTFNNLRKLRC